MSEAATSGEAAPKKKRKIIFLLLPLLLIIALGGAGGFFYFRSSAAGSAENGKGEKSRDGKKSADEKGNHEEHEGEDHASDSGDKPHESDKSREKEATPKSNALQTSLKSALPEDEDVKHVVELQPFIVNLVDEEHSSYLRLTVSLGIGGEEGGEEKPNPLFITRVRNAMLAVLSVKRSDDLLTVEGKAKLRKELLKAAQAASSEPHVEAIYITDFIVQLKMDLLQKANEERIESWRDFSHLEVPLSFEFGRTQLTLREILGMGVDTIIKLSRSTGEGIDVFADNQPLVRGEIVVIEDHAGIRINNIIVPDER